MSFDFFLPLLTYPDPTPEAGLLRAIDLAATLGGRLTIASQVVDIAPITNPFAGTISDYASRAAEAEAASQERAAGLSQRAKHLADRFQLPVRTETFRLRPELLAEHLAAAARTHDYAITILDTESATHLDAAEALLFGSGGAVVLFPGTTVATHVQTVVVAWDGGRAAGRAVRDALPILRQARQVIIQTVEDDKPILPERVAALVSYLNGHEIVVAHHNVRRDARPIGAALQADALERDAGLLVMGAYGHNRFREFVLGGATRTVLSDLRLPVLMSH